MMTNVVEYLSAEPSRPFRIRMASGSTFDIRHPEVLLAGRSSVRVYTSPEGDGNAPARWYDVSLMLMESLEPLDTRTLSVAT